MLQVLWEAVWPCRSYKVTDVSTLKKRLIRHAVTAEETQRQIRGRSGQFVILYLGPFISQSCVCLSLRSKLIWVPPLHLLSLNLVSTKVLGWRWLTLIQVYCVCQDLSVDGVTRICQKNLIWVFHNLLLYRSFFIGLKQSTFICVI